MCFLNIYLRVIPWNSSHYLPAIYISFPTWRTLLNPLRFLSAATMCTSVEPFTGSWATYQGPHPWRKLTHLSTSTSTSSSSFLSRSGALWDFSHKWWGFDWLDLVNILYRQQQSLRSCVQRPAISRKESFSVVLWNLWFLSLPNNTPWHLGKGTMINISHSWISNS